MMDSRIESLLESIDRNTREIAEWLQLAYGSQLRQRLEKILTDEKRRLAYEYSTGANSSRVVASLAGVSDKAVRDWWKVWAEEDIVEESEVAGRFSRRYDLRRLGLGQKGTLK